MHTTDSQFLPPHLHKAVTSPCFVHSQLDSGMVSSEYFKNKQHHTPDFNDVGLANSLQDLNHGILSNLDNPFEDEDELGNSLTKCLAETAVAVRDMSKQLGIFLVRSRIIYLAEQSLNRSSSHSVKYSDCSDRHQSSR